ncbi:MAG: hypothetical protein IJH71_00690 [Eubacterium sp.]|nr:hypothetical protein [Eubacterium sp.]
MNLLIIAPQLTDMTCFLTPSEERTDQSQGQNSSAPCRSYSLYVAKKLKLQDPSINISVLSFGTAKVISKLHDYIAICADQAFLLSDIDLNGPGPVFLGKVLADTVRYIEDRHGDYSLILIDEAFVQSDGILFGPIIAENMGLQTIYPAMDLTLDQGRLLAKAEDRDIIATYILDTKTMLCFPDRLSPPSYPSIERILWADGDVITLSLSALSGIEHISPPVGSSLSDGLCATDSHENKGCQYYSMDTVDELAGKILRAAEKGYR